MKRDQEKHVIAVDTVGLTRYFNNGRVKALDDVSLKVESGQIFSLLGPNGAGKTTFVKVLLGIVLPTRGTARIRDMDIRSHRSHASVGYLAENHRFPEFLSAFQVLYYYGKMAGMSKMQLQARIPELLEQVHLENWMHQKIRKFSKGMLQRLGIAQALINHPRILFLDEPTDGIDPVGRREIRDLLFFLKEEGVTIFLNSHLLSEVELISDEIAILKAGKLLEKGKVDDFITRKEQYRLKIDGDDACLIRKAAEEGIHLTPGDGAYLVKVTDTVQLNRLIDHLRRENIVIEAVIPHKISLEDFFIDVLDEDTRQG